MLLITSRETRRWVIPKGWPIKGLKSPQTAAREAFVYSLKVAAEREVWPEADQREKQWTTVMAAGLISRHRSQRTD